MPKPIPRASRVRGFVFVGAGVGGWGGVDFFIYLFVFSGGDALFLLGMMVRVLIFPFVLCW